MSIGALFVVVKILKRPEWNTVQVILKNHSTSLIWKDVQSVLLEKQAAEKLVYDDPILI